jgi:phosphoadenylyl-sulfate reductase (thioredoxin)
MPAPILWLDFLAHFLSFHSVRLETQPLVPRPFPSAQTLALRENVLDRYGRTVQSFGPGAAATREDFIALYGERLWETDPDFYQYLTKVEPTARALEQLKVDVWITGRRRSQGDARSTLQVLELTPDGRLKVNPLAWVPWDDVSDYVSENDVPYNALLDQGYRSIGDYHSTSPAGQNAPERAGRWSGSFRTECGMHSLHGGAGSRRQGGDRLNSDSTDEEADAPNDDLPAVVGLTLGAAEDDDEDNSSGDEAQVASPDHHSHLRR